MKNVWMKKILAGFTAAVMLAAAVPAAAADFTSEPAAAAETFTDGSTETVSPGDIFETGSGEAVAVGDASETGGSSVAEDVKFVPGTYTVTANLFVPGELNAKLPGVTAYLTNPNNPLGLVDENGSCEKAIPNTPVSANASITIGEDGVTKTLTLPVKNPVFTLQQIGSGDTVEILDMTRNSTVYSDLGGTTSKNGRITKLMVRLKNNSGEYTFKDCQEYPTLLAQEWTVPLTLSVDLASIPQQKEAMPTEPAEPAKTKIDKPAAKSYTWNGKTLTGVAEGTGYMITGTAKASAVGTYTARVILKDNYVWSDGDTGSVVLKWSITKAKQGVKAKTASKTVKYSSVKKKAVSFSIGASAKTKLSYKVISTPKKGAKYITVNAKGKVTLKKKAPKGTYKILVTAAENSCYKAASRTIKIKVK